MADSYRTSMNELDGDDVHRLLPREILEDIGVIIVDPAEQQVPDDVVDDLAARLVSVLGGAPVTKTPCRHSSPQLNAGRGSLAGGKGTVRRDRVVVAVPPPFLPSPPAVPWQVLMMRNSMVIHPTATMLPLAGGALPPTSTSVRHGTGTGVFFPRADELARRTAKAARSPPLALGNGGHARAIHQRRQQTAVAIVKTQQEMKAVAAHMERRRYLGVDVLPHQERTMTN